MRRLGDVLSASLLASAAILLLATCASAVPPPVLSARAPCAPMGARTLASDRAALVFSWHGSVYGCLRATGKRLKLGGAGFCLLRSGRVAPVSLAGKIVAYGLERCGVDTGSSTIVVRSLATAKKLAELPAATQPFGPESYATVESLVLRRDGAMGWIVRQDSIIGRRPPLFEVYRYADGKSSLVDSGTAIHGTSLRLAGSRMTWQSGGATHSAGLS